MTPTPGPWRLEIVPEEAPGFLDGVRIYGADGSRIIGARGLDEQILSDWRLIAAAPDLLAALKRCACPRCEIIFSKHDHPCDYCEPMCAVIAKAEGR